MPIAIFLFIAIFFLVLPFFSIDQSFIMEGLNPICAIFIVLLGIPHGAIDYELYKNQSNVTTSKFFSLYIFTIFVNAVLWFIIPTISFLFFLMVSAYHFGQSQFSNYLINKKSLALILYCSWGVSILSAMLIFNKVEVLNLLIHISDFSFITTVITSGYFNIVFYISGIITITMGIYLLNMKMITLDQFFVETFTFILILLSFYLLPLLVGFTLYFVILHAFKVMKDEFNFMLSYNIVSSVTSFLKTVFPFTILSICGIIVLVIAKENQLINIDITHSLIIIASCITLPHSFVMQNFYNKS